MLLCASNPGKVATLGEWLASQTVKGTELQDAATKSGFEPSFVALVLFPQVVNAMAGDLDWTTRLGQAFTADRSAVFASIQRLRVKAQQAGKLKSTPQQDVETRTTSSGQQVVVIEPANPQVVYVPQYNPQTVYTTSSTVVVQQESSSGNAVAAGLIGFTAGIAIGAAIDNDYYYGPYGWRGGAYMYDDAWDDWDDARDDARDDWQDHREDLVDERGDRASNAQEQRSERQQSAQQQRTEAQQTRQQKVRRRRRSATRGARKRRRQPGRAGAGTSQEARGLQPRHGQGDPGPKRHEIRCVFGLLEWKVRTRRQPARPTQPEQLARRTQVRRKRSKTTVTLMTLTCVTLMTFVSCTRTAPAASPRIFATPEDAVRALIEAAKAGALEERRRDLRTRRKGARRLL